MGSVGSRERDHRQPDHPLFGVRRLGAAQFGSGIFTPGWRDRLVDLDPVAVRKAVISFELVIGVWSQTISRRLWSIHEIVPRRSVWSKTTTGSGNVQKISCADDEPHHHLDAPIAPFRVPKPRCAVGPRPGCAYPRPADRRAPDHHAGGSRSWPAAHIQVTVIVQAMTIFAGVWRIEPAPRTAASLHQFADRCTPSPHPIWRSSQGRSPRDAGGCCIAVCMNVFALTACAGRSGTG